MWRSPHDTPDDPTTAAEEHPKADADHLACHPHPRPLQIRWDLSVRQNDRLDQHVPAMPHQAGTKERSVSATGAAREREWLEGDVARAALLTDADRIGVLRCHVRLRPRSHRGVGRERESDSEPGWARVRRGAPGG